MKSIKSCLKVFFISFSALFLVQSCNNTDDNIVINKFSFENIAYETSHGIVSNYGAWDRPGSFSIILMSSELDNRTHGYEGQGDMVSFWLISSDPSKILPGIYALDKNALPVKNSGNYDFGIRKPNTSFQIGVFITYKAETDSTILSCDFYSWANEGNITINSIENDVYDLDYNFKINEGKNVAGHYKGVLLQNEQ